MCINNRKDSWQLRTEVGTESSRVDRYQWDLMPPTVFINDSEKIVVDGICIYNECIEILTSKKIFRFDELRGVNY